MFITTPKPVGVSCLCKTYGRPNLLEEAIQSFLIQDFAGPKELIVLNDFDAQHLTFTHPEVRVINTQERFPTLGDKHNAIAELARYDLLAPWDDDDIYLPNRLSLSVANLQRGFFKPSTAFVWNNGRITDHASLTFHAQACFTKEIWRAVDGYPRLNVGEDKAFEARLTKQFGVSPTDISASEVYYIYRWHGVGTHLSGAMEPASDADHYKRFDVEIRAEIERSAAPRGNIKLQPKWTADYAAQARGFVATGDSNAELSPSFLVGY